MKGEKKQAVLFTGIRSSLHYNKYVSCYFLQSELKAAALRRWERIRCSVGTQSPYRGSIMWKLLLLLLSLCSYNWVNLSAGQNWGSYVQNNAAVPAVQRGNVTCVYLRPPRQLPAFMPLPALSSIVQTECWFSLKLHPDVFLQSWTLESEFSAEDKFGCVVQAGGSGWNFTSTYFWSSCSGNKWKVWGLTFVHRAPRILSLCMLQFFLKKKESKWSEKVWFLNSI